MAVSECETEIEELEATQKAALAKEQLETKALRAKTKKPKEFQGDENLLAKLTRQRIEWLEKEENLDEEVETTQRNLDLVQQHMFQRTLPPLLSRGDLFIEIAKHVHEREALAFAMTCRSFRDAMKEALKTRKNTLYTGKRRTMVVTTRTMHYTYEEDVSVSEDWLKWAFSTK